MGESRNIKGPIHPNCKSFSLLWYQAIQIYVILCLEVNIQNIVIIHCHFCGNLRRTPKTVATMNVDTKLNGNPFNSSSDISVCTKVVQAQASISLAWLEITFKNLE